LLFTNHALNVAFKGGPNAATFPEENRTHRYGLAGGLAGYLEWGPGAPWSFGAQLELLYSPRGATIHFEGEELGRSREHYLDLIIAARPGVRRGIASVYLLVGGGLSFLLSANREDASGPPDDITDGLRRVDVTLLAGAGAALHLPPTKLGPFYMGTVFIEARYERGLIDTVADGGYQNRTFSVMLGLSFALSSRSAREPTGAHACSASPCVGE
jgi:Outer membrane protein beta-barrel domain